VPAFWPRWDGLVVFLAQVWGPDWKAGVLEEMGTFTGWISLGLFVEWWRAAHIVGGWRVPGLHWVWLAGIPLVLVIGQCARAWLKGETFDAEDRPLNP